MFKIISENTRERGEICSKLTIETPERDRSSVFIVNFERILHLILVFLFLTLNKQMLVGFTLIISLLTCCLHLDVCLHFLLDFHNIDVKTKRDWKKNDHPYM